MAQEASVDHARWLMEQWVAALAAAIESMTEERPQVEFAPAEAGTAAPGGGYRRSSNFNALPPREVCGGRCHPLPPFLFHLVFLLRRRRRSQSRINFLALRS